MARRGTFGPFMNRSPANPMAAYYESRPNTPGARTRAVYPQYNFPCDSSISPNIQRGPDQRAAARKTSSCPHR